MIDQSSFGGIGLRAHQYGRAIRDKSEEDSLENISEGIKSMADATKELFTAASKPVRSGEVV